MSLDFKDGNNNVVYFLHNIAFPFDDVVLCVTLYLRERKIRFVVGNQALVSVVEIKIVFEVFN